MSACRHHPGIDAQRTAAPEIVVQPAQQFVIGESEVALVEIDGEGQRADEVIEGCRRQRC